jgi:P-type Cu2+ transporter
MSHLNTQTAASEVDTNADDRPTTCFHCGLPVPIGADFSVRLDGAPRSMCCGGCQAVAQAIIDGGLTDFYRYRTENAPTGRKLVPDNLRQIEIFDHPRVQRSFVRAMGGNSREAALILEGVTCAACVWLNERYLSRLPGVDKVQINYATRRVRIAWDNGRIRLSEILQAISRIGYRAHPFDPNRSQQLLESERKQHLRRLGVAGALGMQIMILAVALYVGDWSGLEAEFRRFFYWASLALTVPIVAYSAKPFFQAAWRDVTSWRAGMDVPIALGIGGAFLTSVWATVTGQGTVYYDSVAMFVFFLLTGRYFELSARKRATETSESLVQAVPAMATRLIRDQREELVPVAELNPGDRVLIRPGDVVPADGHVLEGRSSVDESLLTGESQPVTKTPEATLVGGSINVDSPLILRVERTGEKTVLSAILRLLDRAGAEKPHLTQLADRVAAWFVLAVLLLATVVAVYWWQQDPTRWLPITIAVLVVTCPCALSLATPTALAAATGRLTRLGLLTTRGHALETLARATHVIFDKTGTLTSGEFQVQEVCTFSELAKSECLRLAASLERSSEHPIARALRAAGPPTPNIPTDVVATPGEGIQGKLVGETYYLGTPAFVQSHTEQKISPELLDSLRRQEETIVCLVSSHAWLATFRLADEPRPDARSLIQDLLRTGKQVWLLTGDHEQAARRVARAVGIDQVIWDQKPEDKFRRIKALQEQGAVVAMVGDGVNDAPVLAAAQVSIAMGNGTHIARASADMILLSPRLAPLVNGVQTARKTLHVIRQNLTWAITYNLIAVPAAAFGYITPWLAALGMSASSLLVVANALRLVKEKP